MKHDTHNPTNARHWKGTDTLATKSKPRRKYTTLHRYFNTAMKKQTPASQPESTPLQDELDAQPTRRYDKEPERTASSSAPRRTPSPNGPSL
ncbi:hypothetical protein ECG_08503 [Echinococcus granulosus]|nr:hypothetical protein ECG_08502 [Echinococcus granulosus]KAH9279302.1 hypothetical protein ECG_08503 [Echinococcus granulosus]